MHKLRKTFRGFFYFYEHLGVHIFFALILSLFVGILDAVGLSMFLPLLNSVESAQASAGPKVSQLDFLLNFLRRFDPNLGIAILLALMFFFFALKGVVILLQNIYRLHLQEFFVRKLRIENIRNLNAISYKEFTKSDSGKIQNTLSGEVDRISRAYQSYFLAVQSMLMVVVYVGFAFAVNAQFAMLVTVGGVLSDLAFRKIYKNTKGASAKLTSETHHFHGLLLQHIHNFKYLKATGTLTIHTKRLESSINEIHFRNRYIGKLNAILNASREPLVILIVSLVIYVQTSFFDSALGPILVSLLFFYRALTCMMMAQSQINFYLSVSGSLVNIEEFSDELAGLKENSGSRKFEQLEDELSIIGGGLRYGEKNALKDVHISIKKNESVAFVGESGSGKTSLVNVLAGLLPLDSGTYLIDGVDRNLLNLTTFRRRVGYITQDPVIFNDTLFNNITLWSEKTKENMLRFESAIRESALFGFVETLEDREDSILGINGINLSGGQKQRISIARELFKNVEILIFDEGTSALDSETEREIQANLDRLKGAHTLLVVAHRLSTIKNVDRVVLMRDGRIELIEPFRTMMEKSARFSRMVALQNL